MRADSTMHRNSLYLIEDKWCIFPINRIHFFQHVTVQWITGITFQLIAHLSCKIDHFWRFFLRRILCLLKWKHLKIVNKIDYNSKHKNQKIDISFLSAHCAPSIEMWAKLRGRGGGRVCISLVRAPSFCPRRFRPIHFVQSY